MTQELREKLLKTCMEFEAIIVPEVGRITYLGTPQTEESIYNALRDRGYEVRIWPARFPSQDVYNGCLAPYIAESQTEANTGKSTDPKRFSDIDLLEREVAYGRSDFALQFMLDTRLSDEFKFPLKTGDLIVFSCNIDKAPISISYGSTREQLFTDVQSIGFSGDRWYRPMFYDREYWQEYEGRVMSIDPSGTGRDLTGYAIVNQLFGNLWCMDCDGLPGGYDESTLLRLAKLAKQFKVHEIIIEANFGDGMFTKLFQPVLAQYHQCKLTDVKHSIQKEKRIIDTLEPVLNQHRLIMDERVVRKDERVAMENKHYSLFYQLTRICKERGALKHDDKIDALAIAVAHWLESMARSEDASIEDWKAQALERELEKFMETQMNRGKFQAKFQGQVWGDSVLRQSLRR